MTWASECPNIKNYKWRLNPVWHRMIYSCTHITTVGVKGLNTTSRPSRPPGVSDIVPNMPYYKSHHGRRPLYWKFKQRHNYAAIPQKSVCWLWCSRNFSHGRCEFHKIQDGRRPPYWKIRTAVTFVVVWAIFTKFAGRPRLFRYSVFMIVTTE